MFVAYLRSRLSGQNVCSTVGDTEFDRGRLISVKAGATQGKGLTGTLTVLETVTVKFPVYTIC